MTSGAGRDNIPTRLLERLKTRSNGRRHFVSPALKAREGFHWCWGNNPPPNGHDVRNLPTKGSTLLPLGRLLSVLPKVSYKEVVALKVRFLEFV